MKVAGDNQTAPMASAVTTAPAVKVVDAAGNGVSGVTVTFAVASGGGAVSGSSVTSDASGVATLGGWTLGGFGANSVTASAGTLAPVTFTANATGRALRISTYATGDPTRPVSVLDNGARIRASTWTTTGTAAGQLTESAYVDDGHGIDVRVSYGPGELPVRLLDRKTNQTITVVQRDGRVDLLAYDAAGRYASGVAVLYLNSKVYLARINANPGITGQLTAASDRLSFSVIAKADAGLGPLVEAPASFSTYFTRTVGAAVTAARAERGPLANLDYAAISADAIRQGLTRAGFALVGAGVALPALGIAAGALPLGLAAAGLGAWVLAASPLPDEFARAWNTIMGEGTSLDETPQETIQSGMSSLSNTGNLVLRTVRTITSRTGDALQDVFSPYVRAADFPVTSGAPPAGASDVDGYAVDQGSTVYPLKGTLNANGQLSASGSAGGRTVSVNGTVSGNSFSGSFGGSAGTGTLSGSVSSLEKCQTQQASGGQGTYSRAFNMGQSTGSVTFTYDAYSIPDAFQVMNGGATVFTTGGTVSGSGAKTFPLSGSAVVFVVVSAPNSGTAWQFSLTCPA